MKKFILLIILCVLGLFSFAQNPNDFNQNKVGDKAPDFKFTTLDGKSAMLSDFKGKAVLLNFFATW